MCRRLAVSPKCKKGEGPEFMISLPLRNPFLFWAFRSSTHLGTRNTQSSIPKRVGSVSDGIQPKAKRRKVCCAYNQPKHISLGWVLALPALCSAPTILQSPFLPAAAFSGQSPLICPRNLRRVARSCGEEWKGYGFGAGWTWVTILALPLIRRIAYDLSIGSRSLFP